MKLIEKILFVLAASALLNIGNADAAVFSLQPDHVSGIYMAGKVNVSLKFIGENCGGKKLKVRMETEFGEPVGCWKAKARTDTAVLSFRCRLSPGFYNVAVFDSDSPSDAQPLARCCIGCSPDKIVSHQNKPADFDEFWDNTLKELAAVSPDYRLTYLPERSDSCLNVYRVDMYSLGKVNVSGIYIEPVAEGRFPVKIHYMGYNTQPDFALHLSGRPDMCEFIMCVRNQGLNQQEGEEPDWMARGLESEYSYYYRGAFSDAVRAVDFVCSREKVDKGLIFAEGESQGGGLTFAAASLDPRITAIAPSCPFHTDFPDYFNLIGEHCLSNMIPRKAESQGMSREELFRVLSYFDLKNLTDRIVCPVLMGVGLQDDICPPHTNFAGYNMVKGDKEWICYPDAWHNVWMYPQWPEAKTRFFSRLIKDR